MAQGKKTVSQRIRTVKSSLENAEQSFSANQEIRGELDLMLAEAELKNLRRKKDVPWSWNRQMLAACAAVLLIIAGIGGWYMAKDHYKTRNQNTTAAVGRTQQETVQKTAGTEAKDSKAANAADLAENPAKTAANMNQGIPSSDAAAKEQQGASVNISKAEMHQLVHTARTELNKAQ